MCRCVGVRVSPSRWQCITPYLWHDLQWWVVVDSLNAKRTPHKTRGAYSRPAITWQRMVGGGGTGGRWASEDMRADRYKPPVGTSSPTRCASPQLPVSSSERWNYQQQNVHFTANLFAMETAATERRGRTGREPGGTPCFWFLNLHRCAGRTPTPTPRTPVTDTQLSQIHRIMVVFGELPCLRSVWEWSAMPHEHEPSLSSRRLSRTHQPPATGNAL